MKSAENQPFFAIFTGVRGFKSGVDFEGFKECLALVAQKIFPDEDPVAACAQLRADRSRTHFK